MLLRRAVLSDDLEVDQDARDTWLATVMLGQAEQPVHMAYTKHDPGLEEVIRARATLSPKRWPLCSCAGQLSNMAGLSDRVAGLTSERCCGSWAHPSAKAYMHAVARPSADWPPVRLKALAAEKPASGPRRGNPRSIVAWAPLSPAAALQQPGLRLGSTS